jgi:sugar/nucleoside kinase (ribokinase family)
LTKGAEGMSLITSAGVDVTVPTAPTKVVDTVGAGDAFVGGFAAEWAAGGSLDAAVRTGSAAGALTATVPGARHPGLDRAGVERLVGRPG